MESTSFDSLARSVGAIGRVAFIALIVALVALGATSSRVRGSVPERSADGRPNLVLITIDSLRADHLGAYGYTRPTSPELDTFAREAVVVTDAVAQAPYTKASIATLMTGLFPTTHQTYTTSVPLRSLQQTGSAGSREIEDTDALSPKLPTLAASLQAAGYTTLGISANPYLIKDFGFANGFSEFTYVKGQSGSYARADEVVKRAVAALADAPRPFFLWIHLMDPHNPYDAPEPYRSMFPALTPAHPIDPDRIPDFLRIGDSNDLNLYTARYDAGIRSADTAIARLFSMLRARHEWAQTGVVVTADHGEGFMEHGLMSHNNSLYNELLHVPLLIKLPGLAPGRVRAQVQLADLFPTLAHLVKAPLPKLLHGSDVLPVLQGKTSGEPYAYSELVNARYSLQSLDWKFIASFQGGRELFDLAKDPHETTNLARTGCRASAEPLNSNISSPARYRWLSKTARRRRPSRFRCRLKCSIGFGRWATSSSDRQFAGNRESLFRLRRLLRSRQRGHKGVPGETRALHAHRKLAHAAEHGELADRVIVDRLIG